MGRADVRTEGDRPLEQWKDGWTNRWTDRPSNRDARSNNA